MARLLSDRAFLDAYLAENARRLAASYAVVTARLAYAGVPFTEAAAGMFVWVDLRNFLDAPTWAAERALFLRLRRGAAAGRGSGGNGNVGGGGVGGENKSGGYGAGGGSGSDGDGGRGDGDDGNGGGGGDGGTGSSDVSSGGRGSSSGSGNFEASFSGAMALGGGVVLTPGESQRASEPGFFRVCYAYVPLPTLELAMARLRAALLEPEA
ncbi:unnamed protein product [Phaeothamnion confervicola]